VLFRSENATLADADGVFTVPLTTPWEVLIPNEAPFSDADLALVSKHAHMCIDHRLNRFFNPSAPAEGGWITLGQQLAAEARTRSNTNSLGVLDLGSSIPGLNSALSAGIGYPNASVAGTPPDETLTIPLALRLFDAFEALRPTALDGIPRRLFNGRININTAPQRVLEALPWVAPWVDYNTAQGGIPASGRRARAMIAYRDGYDPDANDDVEGLLTGAVGARTPGLITRLPDAIVRRTDPINLRRPDRAAAANGRNATIGRGFVSTGELAILDQWSNNPTTTYSATPADSAGALGSFFAGAPGFVREHADPAAPSSFIDNTAFDVDDRFYNVPVNAQAERVSLFRALANIVETRSDVYGAWFVLRAYDPDVIETIRVENDPLDSMEDELFEPAYESRWFVVYDRSGVTRPTDSPEVLLQVQLPSTTR
jgi:hypothetical protein